MRRWRGGGRPEVVLYSVNELYILVGKITEYRVRFEQSAVIFS